MEFFVMLVAATLFEFLSKAQERILDREEKSPSMSLIGIWSVAATHIASLFFFVMAILSVITQ